jgi:uncharacterized protein
MISAELIQYLRANFKLDWLGIHGSPHWSRVHYNGKLLVEREADKNPRPDVISLFAFLHDHMRETDGPNSTHGTDAARNAINLRNIYFTIDDEGFDLLCRAMIGHSDGMTEEDITVQICWDADRLDLGRVGITPDPQYLCTRAAKDPKIIALAYRRSIAT